jgi:hypothetical protein
VDAKRIVGRARSAAWVWIVLLASAGCDRQVDLGAIGAGAAGLLWKATFETGNLSEWTADGKGGTYLDNDLDSPLVTSTFAHGGVDAAMITVKPTASMLSIEYLFRTQPTPTDAYYSAWFYVPSTITVPVQCYLSLMHFRGSKTGDGLQPLPMWDVNLYPLSDGSLAAQLYDYQGQVDTQQVSVIRFPADRWVQLEVHFVKATGPTGSVEVWQDGTPIVTRTGVTTMINDWLEWDAGGGSNQIFPSPSVIYMDDAAISLVRLGPGAAL